jgi:hypothetical protein
MNKLFSKAREERYRKSAAFRCLTLRSQSTVKIPSNKTICKTLNVFTSFQQNNQDETSASSLALSQKQLSQEMVPCSFQCEVHPLHSDNY